jgi:branched-chain amino acid transport system ATP-binding protein
MSAQPVPRPAATPRSGREPLLEVTGVTAGYGRVDVLREISLTIGKGEVVTVVGPNGAGKTTLLKTIGGVIRRRSGRIVLGGEDVGSLRAHALVRRGVTYVPEGREVFAQLSVDENLWLGAFTNLRRRQHMRDVVLEIFPRLAERIGQRAGNLSGGEQQMLAIARGLMSEPKLLLIDEPTLGLAPVLVEALGRWIADVRDRLGTSLLLAEQSAKLATGLSDRMYVLVGGRVRAEADRSGFSDKELFELYIGEKLGER